MKPEQSELALGGLNTRKTDETGDAVGRPSCQSSLLSDPNATFSAEMWRKPLLPALDFVAKELEAVPDVTNPRLLRR